MVYRYVSSLEGTNIFFEYLQFSLFMMMVCFLSPMHQGSVLDLPKQSSDYPLNQRLF